MTREEAIKFAEYAQIMADGKPDVQEFYKLAESALRQQDATDKDVGKWISVKDRLPEQTDPAQNVLFITKTGGLFIGCYYKATAYDQFSGWYSMCVRIDNVTHWMPLPDPPEEGEK